MPLSEPPKDVFQSFFSADLFYNAASMFFDSSVVRNFDNRIETSRLLKDVWPAS